MNKQEFIETFAHFMSEHDLNQAYDGHFPELGHMSSNDIKKWLIGVLTDQSPLNIDDHIAVIRRSLHDFVIDEKFKHAVITFDQKKATKLLHFIMLNTPEKPIWIYDDEPLCPSCGAILDDNEDPCENCGQRIDWSD